MLGEGRSVRSRCELCHCLLSRPVCFETGYVERDHESADPDLHSRRALAHDTANTRRAEAANVVSRFGLTVIKALGW